jgi:hypothetical protein
MPNLPESRISFQNQDEVSRTTSSRTLPEANHLRTKSKEVQKEEKPFNLGNTFKANTDDR